MITKNSFAIAWITKFHPCREKKSFLFFATKRENHAVPLLRQLIFWALLTLRLSPIGPLRSGEKTRLLFVVLLLGILNIIYITPSVAQHGVLPRRSNVYPDTIAIYWRHDVQKNSYQQQAPVNLSIKSPFEETLYEEQVTDSLVVLVVDEQHTREQAYLVEFTYLSMRKPVRGEVSLLTIISKKPEIAALIDLVHTNPSVDNLMLLATAYENEKCFVNAYFIYTRIMAKDREIGKQCFLKFYKQDLSKPSTGAVHR